MNYCCVCGRRVNHSTKSFHCRIGNDVYHYCHHHSLIGKMVLDKHYKTQNKNPYPKYSYNTGLRREDGKPVWGIDSKWALFEIKQGNGLPPLD